MSSRGNLGWGVGGAVMIRIPFDTITILRTATPKLTEETLK